MHISIQKHPIQSLSSTPHYSTTICSYFSPFSLNCPSCCDRLHHTISLIPMSLELIIQEIKAIGNLLPPGLSLEDASEEQLQRQSRRYRVKIGEEKFISRQAGTFVSENQLFFDEAFSYVYAGDSHLLLIEVFKQHRYLDNSDLDEVLQAEVDLSDLTNLNGDYIEAALKRDGQPVGKLILTVETFKRGAKYAEKVSSQVFFAAVKELKEREMQASATARNIKNLIVNNTLTDTLMTISAMTLICEKEDPEIFTRDGFILVKYGLAIRGYSSILRMSSKESANWNDYLQFMKNDGVKFQFFFMHYDELGNLICKAKGEIRYVVFDETINLHSIALNDKRSNKYATLMVKFGQKEVDKVTINNKLDRRIKDLEPIIQHCIEEFNQFKFQNKNMNHILSEKQWELEQKQQQQDEEKQRPLNPEEKKKNGEHSRFIEFLQKEMIKIERELVKREQHHKKDERKNNFLPNIQKVADSRVAPNTERHNNMNTSFSSGQFAKLPKI